MVQGEEKYVIAKYCCSQPLLTLRFQCTADCYRECSDTFFLALSWVSEKLLKTVLKTGFKNSEEDFKKLCDCYQISYAVPDQLALKGHIIKKKIAKSIFF